MPVEQQFLRFTLPSFILLAVFFCGVPLQAFEAKVSIDTTAATAVLRALINPLLTREESLHIEHLPGNAGICRKARKFKIAVTPQDFANALYDAARGVLATDPAERYFLFDRIKPDAAGTLGLVQAIAADPGSFQQPIESRIAMFSPHGQQLALHGYVVAEGDGGGYYPHLRVCRTLLSCSPGGAGILPRGRRSGLAGER